MGHFLEANITEEDIQESVHPKTLEEGEHICSNFESLVSKKTQKIVGGKCPNMSTNGGSCLAKSGMPNCERL